MPKPLRESTGVLEAAAAGSSTPTRRNIQIITPGWGSSGYYSAEVLEAAAKDRVIPKGTHMYLNHASESERHDRPERDVEKIAAVLVEDATWDGTRLTAPADLMGPHAELIESLAPYIGVSISGSATDITIGEAEGRKGPIIEGLAYVDSVDFVTHAGRGGMVLLEESARPSMVAARARAHGVDEATVNDTREQLQTLVRDAYGGDKTYVWVRDFDESTVWFEVESGEDSGVFGQSYTSADGAVSLTGERTEVRVSTTYVPVTRPGSTNTTQESKEDTMPQIEEARLRQLEEDAGRVPTLTAERDTAVAERDTARAQLAERDRRDRAREIVDEVSEAEDVTFDALQVAGLVANPPVTEAGVLDEEKFKTTVEGHAKKAKERAAQAAVDAGAGIVQGFGVTETKTDGITEADFHAGLGIKIGA